ncbi:PROTEIN SENSITIVE TO PROTON RHIZOTOXICITY 1 [Salix koriyanagi]|uniref:PROTEIN SENSITIVE TO PROTON RHIZOTOXICITY 1 n=1 Tax=Salix koriyanagi TaxID=2511006 RepID=A0A9Q0SMM1_9ROSI|nr:PROTEIN SENSITIVE TO PROTON RHIZOTOXICITY 1 [Salix koriyanagi]
MHMRAHGNEFKTLEALARPDKGDKTSSASLAGKTKFSCPFEGCNRNKKHSKFKPLKSVICDICLLLLAKWLGSKAKGSVVGGPVAMEEDEEEESVIKGDGLVDNEFFEGFLNGFGSMEEYNLQDIWGSPLGGIEEFCGFRQ